MVKFMQLFNLIKKNSIEQNRILVSEGQSNKQSGGKALIIKIRTLMF